MPTIITGNKGEIHYSFKYNIKFQHMEVEKRDKHNRPYSAEFAYRDTQKRIGVEFCKLIQEGGMRVAYMLNYIYDNLYYNNTFITINRKSFQEQYGGDAKLTSETIKFLISKDAIRHVRDYEEYKHIANNVYWVNPDVIFYGNYNDLEEELKKRANDTLTLKNKTK